MQKGEYTQKYQLAQQKRNMMKSSSNNSNSTRKRDEGATSSAAMLSSETTDLKLPLKQTKMQQNMLGFATKKGYSTAYQHSESNDEQNATNSSFNENIIDPDYNYKANVVVGVNQVQNFKKSPKEKISNTFYKYDEYKHHDINRPKIPFEIIAASPRQNKKIQNNDYANQNEQQKQRGKWQRSISDQYANQEAKQKKKQDQESEEALKDFKYDNYKQFEQMKENSLQIKNQDLNKQNLHSKQKINVYGNTQNHPYYNKTQNQEKENIANTKLQQKLQVNETSSVESDESSQIKNINSSPNLEDRILKKANKIKGKVNKFFEKKQPEEYNEQSSPLTSGTPVENLSDSNESQMYEENSYSQYHTGDFNRTGHNRNKSSDVKSSPYVQDYVKGNSITIIIENQNLDHQFKIKPQNIFQSNQEENKYAKHDVNQFIINRKDAPEAFNNPDDRPIRPSPTGRWFGDPQQHILEIQRMNQDTEEQNQKKQGKKLFLVKKTIDLNEQNEIDSQINNHNYYQKRSNTSINQISPEKIIKQASSPGKKTGLAFFSKYGDKIQVQQQSVKEQAKIDQQKNNQNNFSHQQQTDLKHNSGRKSQKFEQPIDYISALRDNKEMEKEQNKNKKQAVNQSQNKQNIQKTNNIHKLNVKIGKNKMDLAFNNSNINSQIYTERVHALSKLTAQTSTRTSGAGPQLIDANHQLQKHTPNRDIKFSEKKGMRKTITQQNIYTKNNNDAMKSQCINTAEIEDKNYQSKQNQSKTPKKETMISFSQLMVKSDAKQKKDQNKQSILNQKQDQSYFNYEQYIQNSLGRNRKSKKEVVKHSIKHSPKSKFNQNIINNLRSQTNHDINLEYSDEEELQFYQNKVESIQKVNQTDLKSSDLKLQKFKSTQQGKEKQIYKIQKSIITLNEKETLKNESQFKSNSQVQAYPSACQHQNSSRIHSVLKLQKNQNQNPSITPSVGIYFRENKNTSELSISAVATILGSANSSSNKRPSGLVSNQNSYQQNLLSASQLKISKLQNNKKNVIALQHSKSNSLSVSQINSLRNFGQQQASHLNEIGKQNQLQQLEKSDKKNVKVQKVNETNTHKNINNGQKIVTNPINKQLYNQLTLSSSKKNTISNFAFETSQNEILLSSGQKDKSQNGKNLKNNIQLRQKQPEKRNDIDEPPNKINFYNTSTFQKENKIIQQKDKSTAQKNIFNTLDRKSKVQNDQKQQIQESELIGVHLLKENEKQTRFQQNNLQAQTGKLQPINKNSNQNSPRKQKKQIDQNEILQKSKIESSKFSGQMIQTEQSRNNIQINKPEVFITSIQKESLKQNKFQDSKQISQLPHSIINPFNSNIQIQKQFHQVTQRVSLPLDSRFNKIEVQNQMNVDYQILEQQSNHFSILKKNKSIKSPVGSNQLQSNVLENVQIHHTVSQCSNLAVQKEIKDIKVIKQASKQNSGNLATIQCTTNKYKDDKTKLHSQRRDRSLTYNLPTSSRDKEMQNLHLKQQILDTNESQSRENQQPNRVRFHHENLKDLQTHRSMRHTNISVTSLGSQSGGRGSCHRELSNLNQLRDQKKVSKSIQRSGNTNAAGWNTSAFGFHASQEEEKVQTKFEKGNFATNNFHFENVCGNDQKYSEIEFKLKSIQKQLNKMNEISVERKSNYEGSSDGRRKILSGSFQKNINNLQSTYGNINSHSTSQQDLQNKKQDQFNQQQNYPIPHSRMYSFQYQQNVINNSMVQLNDQKLNRQESSQNTIYHSNTPNGIDMQNKSLIDQNTFVLKHASQDIVQNKIIINQQQNQNLNNINQIYNFNSTTKKVMIDLSISQGGRLGAQPDQSINVPLFNAQSEQTTQFKKGKQEFNLFDNNQDSDQYQSFFKTYKNQPMNEQNK